jgi:hypothetical protein
MHGGRRAVCGSEHAAKINAGLGYHQRLSRSMGITAPLFEDNAESIVSLLPHGRAGGAACGGRQRGKHDGYRRACAQGGGVMASSARRKATVEIPPLESGVYMGICCGVVDFGEQPNKFQDGQNTRT